MAHFHFPLERRFTECAAEGWIVEKRIVAESIGAARLGGQLAFYLTAKRPHQPARFSQGDNTDEPGSALAGAAHSVEQQPIIGLVGRARASVSRRVNTRCSAQSVHLQARIIDEQKPVAMFGIMERLLNCVLFEGSAGLVAGRQGAETGQRGDVKRIGQGQAEFAQFPWIGGGAVQPQLRPPKPASELRRVPKRRGAPTRPAAPSDYRRTASSQPWLAVRRSV